MAFAVTKTWNTGDVLTAAELNGNFDDIEAKINGQLDNTNLLPNAGVLNTQLANYKYENAISRMVEGTTLNLAANYYIPVGTLPYDNAADTYDILSLTHVTQLNGVGVPGTGAVFTLFYGPVAAPNTTTILANISVGTANQGTRVLGAGLATSSVALAAGTINYFWLRVTTQGVGYAAGEFWNISLKLQRRNGLRL